MRAHVYNVGIFVTGFGSEDNLVRALSGTMLSIASIVIGAFLVVIRKPKSVETTESHHSNPLVIQDAGPAARV